MLPIASVGQGGRGADLVISDAEQSGRQRRTVDIRNGYKELNVDKISPCPECSADGTGEEEGREKTASVVRSSCYYRDWLEGLQVAEGCVGRLRH